MVTDHMKRAVEEFLCATKLCDCNHASIQEKVSRLVEGARSPREKALRLHYYVRDEVRFTHGYAEVRASQTLMKGSGDCAGKTNLQMALLRAAGIPARCRVVLVRRESLRYLVSVLTYSQMAPSVPHCWCEAFLCGRWISCEALIDRSLYDGLLWAGLITKKKLPTIDWDGQTDLVILRPWIAEDRGADASVSDAYEEWKNNGERLHLRFIARATGWLGLAQSARQTEKVRLGLASV
jgi:hypothetical protein